MKERTASQLAKAVEEALEASRLSADDLLRELLGFSFPGKHGKVYRLAFSRTLVNLFKKHPEPDKDTVVQFLAFCQALKSAPENMRLLMKQRIKELPHPPGGAPRKVKPEEERTFCAEVIALRSDYDTRAAIRIVALKRGISERTGYRIWGKYHPKKKAQSVTRKS